MKKLVLFLVVFCLAFTVSCKKKEKGDAIRIGVVGPMNFVHGKNHWNGAVLAAEQINARGGVTVGDKIRLIEVIKYDTNELLSITDATNAVQRAVNKDNVDFLVGGIRSEAVLAMQDVAMDYKKIFIGCGAADAKLCARVLENYERYKYWFRQTPFKSPILGKTFFIQLGIVADTFEKELGFKPKVAVVAEKQAWVEPVIRLSKVIIPKLMKLELVGVWQPSQTATDVSAELSAIQRSGAQVVMYVFSGSVGVTLVKQAAELKIPIAMCGSNVEATKFNFKQATGGYDHWVASTGTFVPTASYNDRTQPFIKAYMDRFGESPTYTCETYESIRALAEDIEDVGSLDADAIIKRREKTLYKTSVGTTEFDESHDLVYGGDRQTGLFMQWQDGELKAFWPYKTKFKETGDKEFSLEGAVPYKLPPFVVEAYKKK